MEPSTLEHWVSFDLETPEPVDLGALNLWKGWPGTLNWDIGGLEPRLLPPMALLLGVNLSWASCDATCRKADCKKKPYDVETCNHWNLGPSLAWNADYGTLKP